ncbi:GTPase-activator protein for Ras family GTPase [Acanthamoeba castellanii str. Neff]|uniref:E3 ubiquitin-protein ligase n=1 Tax=Acanthamoeba castellanii (strain ATCC 30010 / Neff) TaxID=1257118 RepID=L8GML6_ACACF|nr:GTPase-activator protein for Ras family GTPase [Acanthamoeba castellanii str. Neff]ELR13461.1 GTPase-activator protein for Ras family GTPase [Acanthamoeba castellanii str. Neff]
MDATTTRREWSAAIAALFPESDECVFPLIERAIDKEVASTACEAQLWREESLMFQVGKTIRANSSASDWLYTNRAKKKEDLEGEALTRWLVACSEKMFKAVLEVIDDSPSLVKRAIKHLYLAAKERFPAFEFRAVGALVGLRCYCPAIVSPELYNLVKPGKEISIVARKALVKIAKLLQNVFNETGVEEDATSPELSQNFIRSCIPKFHSTIFMITEGRRLSDSDINGSGNLPGSIGQAQDADGEPTSPSALSSGMKSLGRKSLFSTKKRTKFSTGGGSSGGGGMDKAEESALTEGGEVTMYLLTRLLSIASSNESVIQQILQAGVGLMFNGQPPGEAKSSVCGRTWGPGAMAYRCSDCQMNSSSCICVDCFKHGNHEGHDYRLYSSGYGGCCDCGDPAAWKPKGASSTESTAEQNFNPEATKVFLDHVLGLLHTRMVSYLKQEENVAGIGLILTFISKGMSRHPTSFWTLSPERRLV